MSKSSDHLPKKKSYYATVEQRQAMVRAYLAGKSLDAAAAEFGFSRTACKKALHARGILARVGGPSQVPADHQEAMVADYLAGMSMEEAAKKLGYSPEACAGALRRRGIAARHIEPTAEQRAEMIRLYCTGMSAKDAAAQLGFSDTACITAMRLAGIRLRTNSEAQRKYPFNEDYFENINTSAKASILGFIAADGCMGGKHSLIVAVHARDKDYVHKIANALGYTAPLKEAVRFSKGRSPSRQVRLNVSSAKLAVDLAKCGILPRKSQSLCPWDGPKELLRFYYLGLVDGDGYWTCSRPKGRDSRIWSMGLTGTFAVTEGFSRFIERRLGKYVAPRPHDSIFRTALHGLSFLQEVAHLLYDDATVYLDRKRAIVERLWQDRPKVAR